MQKQKAKAEADAKADAEAKVAKAKAAEAKSKSKSSRGKNVKKIQKNIEQNRKIGVPRFSHSPGIRESLWDGE